MHLCRTEETMDTLSDVRSEIRKLRFELAKYRYLLNDGINGIEDDIELLRRDLGVKPLHDLCHEQAPQPGPAQAAVAPRPPLVPNTNFRPPEITRALLPQRLDIPQYSMPRPPQSAPPNAPSTFMNRTPITNAPRLQPVGNYPRTVTRSASFETDPEPRKHNYMY